MKIGKLPEAVWPPTQPTPEPGARSGAEVATQPVMLQQLLAALDSAANNGFSTCHRFKDDIDVAIEGAVQMEMANMNPVPTNLEEVGHIPHCAPQLRTPTPHATLHPPVQQRPPANVV